MDKDKQVAISQDYFLEVMLKVISNEPYKGITKKEPMMFMALSHFGMAIYKNIFEADKESVDNGNN